MSAQIENPWRNLRDRVFVPPGCVSIPGAFEAIGRKYLADVWVRDEMFATTGEPNERRLAVLDIMHRLAGLGAIHIVVVDPTNKRILPVNKSHWNTPKEVVRRRLEEASMLTAPEYDRNLEPQQGDGANDPPIFVTISSLRHALSDGNFEHVPFDKSGDVALAEAALFDESSSSSGAVVHPSALAKDKVWEWLKGQFDDPSTSAITKADFLDMAQTTIPRLSERSFKDVWSELAAEYPERTRRGPRKKA
jgi:hypothetical protein